MDFLDPVYARNCDIRRIDKAQAAAFLEANHRIGVASGRYRYGLFVRRSTGICELRHPEGTLVAVAGFSSARRLAGRGRSCEWIRYASLPGIRVVGGMSRVLARFVSDVRPDDIMSYADLSGPDGGEVYSVLGFEYEGIVDKPGFRCGKYRLRVSR